MIGIALYGKNGHQITDFVNSIKGACFCGTFGFSVSGVKEYKSEAELLNDPSVTFVSVCAEMRSEQGKIIRRLLSAGKDVYAEKPLATSAEEIKELFAYAREKGRFLGEMSDTVFQEPYATMKKLIRSGTIGRVIQVHVQKSYPYADWRPQDENRDGGLIRQCAVHAVRIIEQGVGLKIVDRQGFETSLGNPVKGGGLKIAASLIFTTESGAICSVDANYLNPEGNKTWSHEYVSVFGEKGTIEADAQKRSLTITDSEERRSVVCTQTDKNFYLQSVIDYLNGIGERPLTEDAEMRPSVILSEVKEMVDFNSQM